MIQATFYIMAIDSSAFQKRLKLRSVVRENVGASVIAVYSCFIRRCVNVMTRRARAVIPTAD